MSTTTLDLKVTADAKAAVHGLKPLNTALEKAKDEAQDTEHALKELGDRHKVKIDDDAVDRARKEIHRLRNEIRENLKADITADTRPAQRRIRELNASIKAIDNHEEVEVKVDVDKRGLGALGHLKSGVGDLSSLAGPISALGNALGGVAIGAGAVAFAGAGVLKWALTLADNMAQARIAFTQFLGSGKKAETFLQKLQKFGNETPFEFPELVESGKQLLAFGINAKDIIPILTTLGDAAALTGSPVSELTSIWGQMAAKGKVANEELLQFTERGIPAYKILADAMHKPVSEIQKMASDGKLLSGTTLPLLKAGLDKTFGGGMAKQAQTLSGLWSTMSDTLQGIGTKIGEAFTPIVGEQISSLTDELTTMSDWAARNKETIVLAFGAITGSILDFAAETVGAFGDVLVAAAGLLDAFDAFKPLMLLVNLPLGMKKMLEQSDFSKAADSLRGLGGDLDTVEGKLHNTGDAARASAEKWSRSFRESDIAEGMKQQLNKVREHLAELRKKPPSAKVDADIKDAVAKIKSIKAQLKVLRDAKTTAKLDADISASRRKLKETRASLAYLKAQKPTPKVNADIAAAKKKIAELKARIADATKRRTATVHVETAGTAAAAAAIAAVARDQHTTIFVHAARVGASAAAVAGATQSIVPQLTGPGTAGLRGAARAAPQMVATTTGLAAVDTSQQQQGPVTQLQPRQVPVKVYLDGAEIADRLTMKAGRLATSTTLRRRA